MFVLQHGETTHVLGQRAPLPLDILATAAQAGERLTFSPALREARDPQAINATPVVWLHVQTDLPAASVLGQLHALRPAAVVQTDEGVDIYWKISSLGSEDAPRAMESLATALGGSVTSTHGLRPVPLRPADVALDRDASTVRYDSLTAAISGLPRFTPRATVVAHVPVADGHRLEPGDAVRADVAVSTPRFEGEIARAPFDGPPALACEGTAPRSFPEASVLVRALAEAEGLPLEQAWLL